MRDDVEITEKATPFQGYFRIDRYTLRHKKFNGAWSAPMTREIFERGHAAGVLLYDPAKDMVGLIEQFRPGALAAGWEPWLIEIVAGIIDKGQTPEQVAIREAQEEAGVTVTQMEQMYSYLVTPGGSTESMILYCAKVDSSSLSGTHGLAHEGEDIRVFALPYAQAMDWLNSGKISNSMTMLSLLWLALNRDDVRQRWG